MKFFLLIVCCGMFLGAGCGAQNETVSILPDGENGSVVTSSTSETPSDVSATTTGESYVQPLVFHKETSSFVAAAPYDPDFQPDADFLNESTESWTPDGTHRVSIQFVRNESEGVEGTALRIQNIYTGREVDRRLGANETLVFALEEEAGWPMLDIAYDQERNAIVYRVFQKTLPVPMLSIDGETFPEKRALIEERVIRL